MLDFVPDALMVRFQYFLYFGRFLNLRNPVRFSEKLQWYKLYYRDPVMTVCVDKVGVRDYLTEKGYSCILTRAYQTLERASDLRFDMLPNKFVVKYNNGAQRNIIVRDKSSIDPDWLKSQIDSWISTPLSRLGREWSYYNVTGKVFIEEFLEPDSKGDLIDYKFFCFNGEPKFLYVLKDRFSEDGLKLAVYDVEFNKINAYRAGIKRLVQPIDKPKNFEQMLNIAREISKDFPHVRVDLYNIDGRIVFGELTFYDGSGYISYQPDEFDKEIGNMFILPQKKI